MWPSLLLTTGMCSYSVSVLESRISNEAEVLFRTYINSLDVKFGCVNIALFLT